MIQKLLIFKRKYISGKTNSLLDLISQQPENLFIC